MIERLLTTIRSILFDEFPKNSSSVPVVYGTPINNWYYADRQPKPDSLTIIIAADSVQGKDEFYATRSNEHSVVIKTIAGGTDKESVEKNVQEMGRLVNAILLKHRRIWVMDYCPFCGKMILSPEHYIISHNSILSGYVTTAVNTFNSEWTATHDSSPPTLPTSGKAVRGLVGLWNAVTANPADPTLPASLTSNNIAQIQSYNAALVFPVRCFYDFKLVSGKTSNSENGKELFHTGEYTYKTQELVIAPSFGPDNVNTGAI